MTVTEILIGIFATAFLGWMGWVSMSLISGGKEINRLRDNSVDHKNDVDGVSDAMMTLTVELKASFKELGNEVKSDMDRVNNRLDLFIKTEIDELKQLKFRNYTP